MKFPKLILKRTLATTVKSAHPTLKKSEVNLSYKIIGASVSDSIPVVILHGLLCRKRLWSGIGKTIYNVTKRTVITVDLRNHGKSPHLSSHEYEELTADIDRLLDKLDLDKTFIIGHDMGGRTAMCLSLLEPKKVAGLVIVDISPIASSSHFLEFFPKLMQVMAAVDFSQYKTLNVAKVEVRKMLKDIVKDPELMRAVLSNIQQSENKMGWQCNIGALMRNFKSIASFPEGLKQMQFVGPILFIGGQVSEEIQPDHLNVIRAMFPFAVIKYIQSTGHYLHIEDTRSFLEAVIAFLQLNDNN